VRRLKRSVVSLDRWMHFHRFDCTPLCFVAERAMGTPDSLLTRERAAHTNPQPHVAGMKYRRHPSHEREPVG
jgi:hypothetical protein